MDKKVKKAGRYMSLLLRHDPAKEHLDINKFGYVNTKQLISRLDISMSDLEEIVSTNDKQRFTFNSDKSKIRANQGHSFPVDLELKPVQPPDILYHGTATKNLNSIYKNGINSGSRNYLHLSTNIETATQVGNRHGKSFILNINAKQMYKDGYNFYLSKNNVWLVDFVPRKYIMN